MPKTILSCALLVLLAACGGGGGGGSSAGGGGPVVVPTLQPQSYKVHVAFDGGASLRGPQTVKRRDTTTITLHPLASSGSTQLPIEVGAAPTDSGSALANQVGDQGGAATVEVSPQPSQSPNVALTTSGITLTVQPLPSAPAGASFSVSQTYQAPTSGSVVADVSGSATASETVPVYVINRSLIACGSTPVYGNDSAVHAGDQIGATQYQNGTGSTVTTTGSADVYMDGPNCTSVGFVNNLESEATLHFPYGATFESSPVAPFATLSALAWSNSFTSITWSNLLASSTAASNPGDEILAKTSDGHIVKIALNSMQTQGSQTLVVLYYLYAESGFSVDGF